MRSMPQNFSKKLFLINCNWTSVKQVAGWKHYRIAARRRSGDGALELEMMAVCDRNVRIWVGHASLRDPALWLPGWLD